jgi:hypothetical protein
VAVAGIYFRGHLASPRPGELKLNVVITFIKIWITPKNWHASRWGQGKGRGGARVAALGIYFRGHLELKLNVVITFIKIWTTPCEFEPPYVEQLNLNVYAERRTPIGNGHI